jgi:hypothetical protein
MQRNRVVNYFPIRPSARRILLIFSPQRNKQFPGEKNKMKKIILTAALSVLLIAGLNTSAFANKALFPTVQNRTEAAQTTPSKVVYYGGPVISNVKLYVVYWGTKVRSAVTTTAPDFYKTLVTSSYLDWLKEYNTNGVSVMNGHAGTNQMITRGTYAGTITISPAVTSGTLADEDIQKEIQAQVDAGKLPAPTDNTLFMIHFPPGMTLTIDDGNGGRASSCEQFCAYHEGFKSPKGQNTFYGVIPDLDSFSCSMGCGANSADRFTTSASHEVTEAITDGFPTPGTTPNYPQAWNSADGNEVSDLCQDFSGNLTGGKTAYKVAQSWDNNTNACHVGDFSTSAAL